MGTATILSIRAEWRDGTLYLSSDDVPGLFLSGDDQEAVMHDLIPAIKALFKMNRGVDVDVYPVAPSSQFPEYGAVPAFMAAQQLVAVARR